MKSSGARPLQKTMYDQTYSQLWIKKDLDQSNLIVKETSQIIVKLLSKRQLQEMIKQREKTRVTIFRLADTSLHQVY